MITISSDKKQWIVQVNQQGITFSEVYGPFASAEEADAYISSMQSRMPESTRYCIDQMTTPSEQTMLGIRRQHAGPLVLPAQD